MWERARSKELGFNPGIVQWVFGGVAAAAFLESAMEACMKAFLISLAVLAGLAAGAAPAHAADEKPPAASAPAQKKPTLAVLPFVGSNDKEKELAEQMRFAVSQKIVNDADGGGKFDRMDNVQVEQMISALGIPWAAGGSAGPGTLPDADDLEKVLTTLGTDKIIAGTVKGRKLTLMLYEGATLVKTAAVEIPSARESPKLAVEKVLTDLTGATFAHMRTLEADHSNPAVEKRFAANPNLVTDPDFAAAAKDKKTTEAAWDAILGPNHYAPPLLTAEKALQLGEDQVAVVPRSVADAREKNGYCLMMRMSKNVAESNGLACESTWIPVTAGKKYRFTCRYYSQGPTARLFLKGFAYKPDQYGDKNDPEAVRREYYRAQVAPRNKNSGFELIEMDFTPSSLKPTDPKIEWMRVDLYVYLHPGTIFFDDIVMKKLDE
jgi:hypothetical protein